MKKIFLATIIGLTSLQAFSADESYPEGMCTPHDTFCFVITVGIPADGKSIPGGSIRLDRRDFHPKGDNQAALLVQPETGGVYSYDRMTQASSSVLGRIAKAGVSSGEWQFSFLPEVVVTPGEPTRHEYKTCVEGVFGKYTAIMQETIWPLTVTKGSEVIELEARGDYQQVGSRPFCLFL